MSQATESKGLTEDKVLDCKSNEGRLLSSFDSSLFSDPDFRLIAERWAELSDEMKAAVLRLIE